MTWGGNRWDRRSRPRRPAQGIQARSQRGAFGDSWWAQRWSAVLERFGWASRLQRGRSYARSGQVVNINIKPGQVKAQVQGSRPRPYDVRINLAPLTEAEWARVFDALASQAIFSARLLAGEMPQDVESVFALAGVPLFPERARDLKTDCSCPDVANPCKHIAAVYYLLGERFDDDPFMLFELRGRNREQVMEALRTRRAQAIEPVEVPAAPAAPSPAAGLDRDLARFYQAGPELDTLQLDIAPPPVAAGVLRRLGPPPGEILNELWQLYNALTPWAYARVYGEAVENGTAVADPSTPQPPTTNGGEPQPPRREPGPPRRRQPRGQSRGGQPVRQGPAARNQQKPRRPGRRPGPGRNKPPNPNPPGPTSSPARPSRRRRNS